MCSWAAQDWTWRVENQGVCLHFFVCFLNILFIYFFRERRRTERKRKGEKHWCARETSIDWGPGSLPSHVPWPELNWRPFSLQATAQSTEPYQPEQDVCLLFLMYSSLPSHLISSTFIVLLPWPACPPHLFMNWLSLLESLFLNRWRSKLLVNLRTRPQAIGHWPDLNIYLPKVEDLTW